MVCPQDSKFWTRVTATPTQTIAQHTEHSVLRNGNMRMHANSNQTHYGLGRHTVTPGSHVCVLAIWSVLCWWFVAKEQCDKLGMYVPRMLTTRSTGQVFLYACNGPWPRLDTVGAS